MILAYEFNGTRIPDWEDGPMIAFIPEDGAYSNDDCLNTSCPNQGCNEYLSAGSRWVRNAASLVLRTNDTGGTSFTFAVMGDSQGNTLVLDEVVTAINERNPDFVLHLGDTVPKALDGLLDVFVGAIDQLDAPIWIMPGNHDVMYNDTIFYEYFDTGDYYLDRGDCRFISLDSATQDITDDQFSWLCDVLNESEGKRLFVFSHVPSYDPRGGEDEPHTLDDPSDCTRFQSIMSDYEIDYVLNGHIHIYHEEVMNETQYIISGGAGAALYAPPEEGGYHHFLMFTVTGDSITWEVVEVEEEDPQSEYIIVSGSEGEVNVTLNELMTLTSVDRYGQYQNVYGNWKAEGNYSGVLVSDLLDMVGGMGINDTLRVSSVDGYYQDFCYWNVYPNSTWLEKQGPFLIGYMYEGDVPPEWENGFRSLFLPEDGAYSNQDCIDTSCEGQGGHVYESGGARWVK
jgi:predicted phosphodiesterase